MVCKRVTVKKPKKLSSVSLPKPAPALCAVCSAWLAILSGTLQLNVQTYTLNRWHRAMQLLRMTHFLFPGPPCTCVAGSEGNDCCLGAEDQRGVWDGWHPRGKRRDS